MPLSWPKTEKTATNYAIGQTRPGYAPRMGYAADRAIADRQFHRACYAVGRRQLDRRCMLYVRGIKQPESHNGQHGLLSRQMPQMDAAILCKIGSFARNVIFKSIAQSGSSAAVHSAPVLLIIVSSVLHFLTTASG
jgi:hypothetical protein